MTARTRKKPPGLRMPALYCQVGGCGEEYKPIGDYADTYRAAELGGWLYRAGQYVCPGHRDHVPWWPGPPLLAALPVREPGATRAEFLGVVRDTPAALPAPQEVPRPVPEANATGPGDLHDADHEWACANPAGCPDEGACYIALRCLAAPLAHPDVPLPAPGPDGQLTNGHGQGDTQVLPVLPHRHPGQALASAEADDQAQHDATMLLVRSGADPADIAALAAPEPEEDTP
jgi:hypothetical protein